MPIILIITAGRINQFNCCSVNQSIRTTLPWRRNGHGGVSNHQTHHCLLNRLFRVQIKENIKAPRHWLLCGEFTGDRWIPGTKSQWRGKMFPFDDVIMNAPWYGFITWHMSAEMTKRCLHYLKFILPPHVCNMAWIKMTDTISRYL